MLAREKYWSIYNNLMNCLFTARNIFATRMNILVLGKKFINRPSVNLIMKGKKDWHAVKEIFEALNSSSFYH
jgi:hypothetical protein